MKYFAKLQGKQYEVDVQKKDGSWRVTLNGKDITIENLLIHGANMQCFLDQRPVLCAAEVHGDLVTIQMNQSSYSLYIGRSKETPFTQMGNMAFREEIIRAPMPGLVVSVKVNAGEAMEKGDAVIILEAMKMENELRSPVRGIIKEICVKKGNKVEKGEVLAVIERS